MSASFNVIMDCYIHYSVMHHSRTDRHQLEDHWTWLSMNQRHALTQQVTFWASCADHLL